MSARLDLARAIRGRDWDDLTQAQKSRYLRMADRALLAMKPPAKKGKLVDDWRSSWKWASMQFNALAAVLVGLALNNLDVIASVLAMAPPELRAFIPIPVAAGVFVTVAGLRLWKQNK